LPTRKKNRWTAGPLENPGLAMARSKVTSRRTRVRKLDYFVALKTRVPDPRNALASKVDSDSYEAGESDTGAATP